ncbi:hypothetical protein Tco_0167739 [Tanacetum coccineum]
MDTELVKREFQERLKRVQQSESSSNEAAMENMMEMRADGNLNVFKLLEKEGLKTLTEEDVWSSLKYRYGKESEHRNPDNAQNLLKNVAGLCITLFNAGRKAQRRDAQSLLLAIEKRFGRNDLIRRTQRNLLITGKYEKS